MVGVHLSRVVASVLDQDPVLREAHHRGLLNLRALARWIIATKDLDTTEEAVLSAIRRHTRTRDSPPGYVEAARETLKDAHVNMRSHLAIIAVDKTEGIQNKLPQLFETVDYTKSETLRVIQSERSIKVIIDESNLETVLSILGKDQVSEIHRGLAEVHIILAPTAQDVPAVGGLMLLAIGMRGISIKEVLTGIPEALVLVDEADALAACNAIMDLIHESKGTKRRPERDPRAGDDSGADRPPTPIVQ